MPRYIDAEKLFDWGKFKLSDAVKWGNKDNAQQAYRFSTMMMYEIADEINAAPTADVAEVKRGEWKPITVYATKTKYVCSVCGRTIVANRENPEKKFPYCHCGALMKGE